MKSIKEKLSIAACTLVSCSTQQAVAYESNWDMDFSYLFYSEADNRATIHKAITNISSELSDYDRANVLLVLDTMSGSTPSGAVRSPSSTMTGASGISDIAKFNDTRMAVNLNWEHDIDRLKSINYGGNLSVENDFQSYGASLSFSQDSENRMRTYTAEGAVSYNVIARRSGGTPEPLSPTNINSVLSDGIRYTYDGLVGISQVLNKKTIGQLNYSFGYSEGYHSDPYKVISLVELIADPNNLFYTLNETNRFYEGRPESRQKHTLFTSMAHQYGKRDEVIHLSYRYYVDNWDINAHTVDLKHRKLLKSGRGRYIEPHIRLHKQSAASFFMHSIPDNGAVLPKYASADYRLDSMTSISLGLTYGRRLLKGKLRTHIEYMSQSFESAEYNSNNALIFQISYQNIFD